MGDIPSDLNRYYRQWKPYQFAFICPRCKMVFQPELAGMPGSFRAHVREIEETGGCPFFPKPGGKAQPRSSKRKKGETEEF